MRVRNYKRWAIVAGVLVALVLGGIGLFSSKSFQLWILRRAVGVETLSFSSADLSWGEARLQGLEIEGFGILLQAREVEASFSLWNVLFGNEYAVDTLRMREARLKDVAPLGDPWPGRLFAALDQFRSKRDLLRVTTLSLEGVWERMDGTEVPLSFQGENIDFSGSGVLNASVGLPSSSDQDERSWSWSLLGDLSWQRDNQDLILRADGKSAIRASFFASALEGVTSLELRLAEDRQSLSGEWQDGDRKVLDLDLTRDSPELPFSGDVDCIFSKPDLATLIPLAKLQKVYAPKLQKIFALAKLASGFLKLETRAKLNLEWNPEEANGGVGLKVDGGLSFPKVPFSPIPGFDLFLEGNASFVFDSEEMALQGLGFDLFTHKGKEQPFLRGSQTGTIRFPGLIGEDAEISVALRKLALGDLQLSLIAPKLPPWLSEATVSELNLHAFSEGKSWRGTIEPFDLLHEEVPLARVSNLSILVQQNKETGWSSDLDVNGSGEALFLTKVLPHDGPLAAFRVDDARGSFQGGLLASSTGFFLKPDFFAQLETGSGARRLYFQLLRKAELDFGQLTFFLPSAVGDYFILRGENLPIDGLLRWEGGGEAQGDLQALSGKGSFEEDGWHFRTKNALEIDNARILHRQKNYGEGLRIRTRLDLHLDSKESLHLHCTDFFLQDREREALSGQLSFGAKASSNGGFFVDEIESSELKVDLKTLHWAGFPELAGLQAGFGRIGKMKVSFGDELSLELDGALENYRVAEDDLIAGGFMATVERKSDGLSASAEVTLTRGNRKSDLNLDLFIPNEGNASLGKRSVNGDEVHAQDLKVFVTSLLPPGEMDAILSGKLLPDWLLGNWEVGFEKSQVPELPPFNQATGKLEIRPDGVSLHDGHALWLDGSLSFEGNLGFGDSESPGLRFDGLNAQLKEVSPGAFLPRLKGLISGEINGTASGANMGEALESFSGSVALSADKGNLLLGPHGDVDRNETSLSLTELSKVLEGDTTFREGHETLLKNLDAELKTIGFSSLRIFMDRNKEGNCTISEISMIGPAFQISGKGRITSFPSGEGRGDLSLNLSLGARDAVARTLDALEILAPVKTKGEYRLIKKDPLFVAGTLDHPDFSNFWIMIAESLGLGSFDAPPPN